MRIAGLKWLGIAETASNFFKYWWKPVAVTIFPDFLFPKCFLEREIKCNQGAMWSGRAGGMQNKLAQQRQVSRSCLFCCYLSENHKPCAKHGMSLKTTRQILWLLFRFLFRCFVPLFFFFSPKICRNNRQQKSERKSGRDFSTANLDPNRQGGLHMNAGSGAGQIFTSMTTHTSHSLEAYPITTPPPKRVSDWMCQTTIHE